MPKTKRKHKKSKTTWKQLGLEKQFWKTSKQLGLPDKRSPSTNICLEAKNGLILDPSAISEVFKKLFSNLANGLVQKLPAAAKKFDNKSVEDYYNDMFNLNPKN